MRFMQASNTQVHIQPGNYKTPDYIANIPTLCAFIVHATVIHYRGNSAVKWGHSPNIHKVWAMVEGYTFTMGKPTDKETEKIMEEDLHADFETPLGDDDDPKQC